MKNNFIILTLLCLSLIVTFIIGYREGERRSEGLETSDTVIISKRDTLWKDTIIEKTKYIPRKVEIIKHDTITKDTVLTYEQKTYEDTIAFDNDSILLTNVISGVDAKLDSTHVTWKKQKEIVTNTIYITREKEKTFWDRFHIQPQATAGWNPIDGKCAVVVGFGIGFDL